MMAGKPIFAPIVTHHRVVGHQNDAISLILNEPKDRKGRTYAFLQYYTMLKMIQQSFSGIERLHVAKAREKASVHTSLTCFLLKLQFPYVRQFNRVTIHLFSSGIYQLWLDNEFRNAKMYSLAKTSNNNSDKQSPYRDDDDSSQNDLEFDQNNDNVSDSFRSLTLSQLMVCFHLYLMALAIATLVAIVEFLWFIGTNNLLQSVIIDLIGQSIIITDRSI